MKKFFLLAFFMLVISFTSCAVSPEVKKYPIPPKGHPRLYIRSNEISDLQSRMESSKGKSIIRQLEKYSIPRTAEEEAAETDRGFRYYFKMRGLTSKVQLEALNYLVYKDKKAARLAITSMLDSLQKTNFGRKHDLSRASGVMLMVGAMVYDWCYDQMSDKERSDYIKEFVRIAGTMECGYPPKRSESMVGHGSEWMILRDMLSCGIAIYDEYPEMYNYVIHLLVDHYQDVRSFFYSAGNYHQGTGYVNVRLSNDLICQWIMYKMGVKDFFDPNQRYVLYDFIYRRRPDGQVIPAGDVNHNRKRVASYSLPAMFAASYYNDPYIQNEFEIKPSVEPHCQILRLLWQNFDLEGKLPDDLPLSRFSPRPFGWMIARTGWGNDAVIAEMKINENFFGNHQHLDGGSFQLYYKGPLAIDTGVYQSVDGGYNSQSNKNYTKRTIAHNSLLIYDPDEVFECYNYGGSDKTQFAGNDGGQRMPGEGWDSCRSFEDLLSDEYTVGKTLGHGFGPDKDKPDYTYLKGDITKAYSSKVKDVRRSFVFLNLKSQKHPAALLVHDYIESTNPKFKKYWLLHSIEEPVIDGKSFTVKRTLDGDSGVLKCDMLEGNASLRKIGGPGKEFWVFGKNYNSYPTKRRPDPEKEYGQWRVEEVTSGNSAEDVFFNVMQVYDKGISPLPVAKIEGRKDVESDLESEVVGAIISDRVVTFSRNGHLLTDKFSLEIPSLTADFTSSSTSDSHEYSSSCNNNSLLKKVKEYKILVTDLSEGKWRIFKNGKKYKSSITVSSEDGTLYFKGKVGTYTFEKIL